jgi:hypothetical protein
MLQRLRTALCSYQSNVCIFQKLRKFALLLQVISSLGTNGTHRVMSWDTLICPIVWAVENTSLDEVRNCLGLLWKQLLSQLAIQSAVAYRKSSETPRLKLAFILVGNKGTQSFNACDFGVCSTTLRYQPYQLVVLLIYHIIPYMLLQ